MHSLSHLGITFQGPGDSFISHISNRTVSFCTWVWSSASSPTESGETEWERKRGSEEGSGERGRRRDRWKRTRGKGGEGGRERKKKENIEWNAGKKLDDRKNKKYKDGDDMEYICDIIGNRLCPYVYTHAYTSMMLMAQIVCVCV